MPKLIAATAIFLVTFVSYATEAPRVQFGAFGALRVGMSEAQVARAAGSKLVHVAPEAEEEGCFYGSVRGLPKGASLMFNDGRLARIDVFEPGIRTWSGAEVGMTEQALKQIYKAQLRQSPHAYTGPEGHYLTLLSPNQTLGIRFETDGSKVTGYYSGTAEAIQYIEGCQ
jgi:hypothetical protein